MANRGFDVPAEERYFEDYIAGSVYEFGSIVVEEEEIIAFAKRYDPQVFHTDPEAARRTVFGGLIASGWHTAAIQSRLFKDHFLTRVASLGSPGIDELRWLKPVRPGDTLSIRVTILETKRSRSKPDRGVVLTFTEVMNQNREVVMSEKGATIIGCRNKPAIDV
jgi:acyl dehydratase